jgi:hypothetical protein
MMSDFNNRIAAQRDVLVIVNTLTWKEPLYGLSAGAMDRWKKANAIEESSLLASLLVEAADQLFFLSNKSQEQITEEYKSLVRTVRDITQKIKLVISEISDIKN